MTKCFPDFSDKPISLLYNVFAVQEAIQLHWRKKHEKLVFIIYLAKHVLPASYLLTS